MIRQQRASALVVQPPNTPAGRCPAKWKTRLGDIHKTVRIKRETCRKRQTFGDEFETSIVEMLRHSLCDQPMHNARNQIRLRAKAPASKINMIPPMSSDLSWR